MVVILIYRHLFLQKQGIIGIDRGSPHCAQFAPVQQQPMQAQILLAFNHFTFHHSAQILLALLEEPDLQRLLLVLQQQQTHAQLAHLLRARIIVLGMHRLDRSLYFLHFQTVPQREFQAERCSLVAAGSDEQTLKQVLVEMEVMERKGLELLGEEYSGVDAAVSEPDLPLPPIRRETIAPHCQSVYQVVLACQRVSIQPENSNILGEDDEASVLSYFFQLLTLQVKKTVLYLSSLRDPLEHFAEITYRFMVYRNSVLALHELSPFPRLSNTMQLWKNAMLSHYCRSNQVFLQIAGFQSQSYPQEYGRFTAEMLRMEGYLIDYTEGIIDLSVDEDTVAFCGHSKAIFGPVYSHLEQLIITGLKGQREGVWESLQEQISGWEEVGLKPSTIRKIIQALEIESSAEEQDKYCRQDDYIETCARIHGLMQHSHTPIGCM